MNDGLQTLCVSVSGVELLSNTCSQTARGTQSTLSGGEFAASTQPWRSAHLSIRSLVTDYHPLPLLHCRQQGTPHVAREHEFTKFRLDGPVGRGFEILPRAQSALTKEGR
jgi:hypothetical protein